VSRRTSTNVAAIGAAPWVAIVGGVEHPYKTRSGAINRLTDELDHWIRWARFYNHEVEQRLQTVRDAIVAAHVTTDWNFDIEGLPGHCGLRVP